MSVLPSPAPPLLLLPLPISFAAALYPEIAIGTTSHCISALSVGMSLGPFGQLMMKSLSIGAAIQQAVPAKYCPDENFDEHQHSKSLYTLLFLFLLLLWLLHG